MRNSTTSSANAGVSSARLPHWNRSRSLRVFQSSETWRPVMVARGGVDTINGFVPRSRFSSDSELFQRRDSAAAKLIGDVILQYGNCLGNSGVGMLGDRTSCLTHSLDPHRVIRARR